MQIFKFSNGQIEKHFPDKTKIICFPDGTKKLIKSDGNEQTIYPNGVVQINKLNDAFSSNSN